MWGKIIVHLLKIAYSDPKEYEQNNFKEIIQFHIYKKWK